VHAFLRLRRFVDRDLSRRSPHGRSANLSIWIGLIPLTPFVFLARPHSATELVIAACLSFISLCWAAFVAWRCSRLIRASGARGDRDFDRHTKPMLGREYKSAESATKARVRRRRTNSS
jgi:hypothetical protein